jgi:oxysterol-binding protein 1
MAPLIHNIMSLSISSSSSSSRLPSGGSSSQFTLTEPLYQVKLLSALRSGTLSSFLPVFRSTNPQHLGDPALIHPFLAGLGKGHNGGGENDLGAAALHLAVRCASGVPLCSLSWLPWDPHSFAAETVSLLLCHRSISPNAIHPPASGTTALHLAASLGRADVVNLLLEQESIDDTLRDSNGKTCIDVARGKDVLSVINGTSTHISS